MFKYLLIISFSISLIGCDPAYQVIISNSTNEPLLLKTSPSLESLGYSASFRDTILKHKINYNEGLHIYQIPPNKKLMLFAHIGFRPIIRDVPFTFVQLINNSDTLSLDSPREIVDASKVYKNSLFTHEYRISLLD